jgi:hypothetical protein
MCYNVLTFQRWDSSDLCYCFYPGQILLSEAMDDSHYEKNCRVCSAACEGTLEDIENMGFIKCVKQIVNNNLITR